MPAHDPDWRAAAWEAAEARLAVFARRWELKIAAEFREEGVAVARSGSRWVDWSLAIGSRRKRWITLYEALWREAAYEFGGELTRNLGGVVEGEKESKAADPEGGGWSYNPWSAKYRKQVLGGITERVTQLIKGTKKKLKDVFRRLTETVDAEEYMGVITTPPPSVVAAYEEMAAFRSHLIANNEAAAASMSAETDAAISSGIVNTKTWLTRRDNRVRHTHRRQEGLRIPLNGTFPNGCRFPGDPEASLAETINCRCRLAYGASADSFL